MESDTMQMALVWWNGPWDLLGTCKIMTCSKRQTEQNTKTIFLIKYMCLYLYLIWTEKSRYIAEAFCSQTELLLWLSTLSITPGVARSDLCLWIDLHCFDTGIHISGLVTLSHWDITWHSWGVKGHLVKKEDICRTGSVEVERWEVADMVLGGGESYRWVNPFCLSVAV